MAGRADVSAAYTEDVSRPRIGITVGDPAGIGPEIVDKTVRDPGVLAVCEPVVFATPTTSIRVGNVSGAAGQASFDTIVRAVEAAQAGKVDAIATAPISKLAFANAGLSWKGHTDLLAHLCGVSRVAMMFYSADLKVVLITVHVPLADVPGLLTQQLVEDTITLTAQTLPKFGIRKPRLGLAGLNPHAGESGVLGKEDGAVLVPAVAAARARGIDVSGPFPADTVFLRAVRKEFDCVLACYHDQGLIPVKLLAFGKAVNVTIGLPIIRTSVDHGTAFDIAGQGVADPGSMIEAVKLAATLASAR
jgi:4-hydroxythreonine-4-phosphate dehydrogenase